MKKHLSSVISLIALVFPVCYFLYCISDSRLIGSDFVFGPLTAAAAALVFSFIKRIPDGIRIAVSSVSFAFCLGLFALAMMFGGPDEFIVKTGDDAILAEDRLLTESVGGYESARMYEIHGSDGAERYVQIIKFNEEDFSEAVSRTEENHKPYEGIAEGYDNSTGISLDGFTFMLDGTSAIPYMASLTGINPETREIAVVCYGWPSGDISEIDEDFINYQCGWRFVKPYEKGGKTALYRYCLTEN